VTRRRIWCRSACRATQNFFLRESLARTNNIAQKIFSSIAHIQQSSKKFLAKNNSVARTRELSSLLLVSHRCEIRASMRARETERILRETAVSAMPALGFAARK